MCSWLFVCCCLMMFLTFTNLFIIFCCDRGASMRFHHKYIFHLSFKMNDIVLALSTHQKYYFQLSSLPFQSHSLTHHRNDQWQSHKYTQKTDVLVWREKTDLVSGNMTLSIRYSSYSEYQY